MTLHNAIEQLLIKSKTPLSAADIALVINKLKLYTKGDGSDVKPSQIAARVNKYPLVFIKENGLIGLKNKDFKTPKASKNGTTQRLSNNTSTTNTVIGASSETLIKKLLNKRSFKSAKLIDNVVPNVSGLYCIRITNVNKLPKLFAKELIQRKSDVLYVGLASKSLHKRLLQQELRANGHGTFFRSLGAVLGFLPPKGSLLHKKNKRNYKFSSSDEIRIINWINNNLIVNWVALDGKLENIESELILKSKPILNISKNLYKMNELTLLRKRCVQIANGN